VTPMNMMKVLVVLAVLVAALAICSEAKLCCCKHKLSESKNITTSSLFAVTVQHIVCRLLLNAEQRALAGDFKTDLLVEDIEHERAILPLVRDRLSNFEVDLYLADYGWHTKKWQWFMSWTGPFQYVDTPAGHMHAMAIEILGNNLLESIETAINAHKFTAKDSCYASLHTKHFILNELQQRFPGLNITDPDANEDFDDDFGRVVFMTSWFPETLPNSGELLYTMLENGLLQ